MLFLTKVWIPPLYQSQARGVNQRSLHVDTETAGRCSHCGYQNPGWSDQFRFVSLSLYVCRDLKRREAQGVHLSFNSSAQLCCLMSSDVGRHPGDKLRPMPKHGSIILYVHGNQKARWDGQPRTATSTLLNYDPFAQLRSSVTGVVQFSFALRPQRLCGLLGTGAQDGHLHFHTAPVLSLTSLYVA